MTEEIIVDGVNVAGCANLDSLICNCGVICKGRNCYYKQLKRLEQENKELKEENKTLNYQWHKQSEIGDEWYKVAEKCKSALEEIRENLVKLKTNDEDDFTYEYSKIEDKINEVLQ